MSNRKVSSHLQSKPHQNNNGLLSRNLTGHNRMGQKNLKKKKCSPIILCPANVSSINETEVKSFLQKQILREFSNTRLALQEILKGSLNSEAKK